MRAGRRIASLLAALLACGVTFASGATPSRDAAPPPADGYYRSSELDVRPGIKTHVEPEYPEAAARRGLSGKVVLRLFINENGAVDRVETLRARPAGVFERSAERAFRSARFTPGMKDKHPVKTQMTIEVSFDTPPPERPAGWR
ncbi:MAG: energy transducer TonB [Burkholderiales bacterium]